VSESAAALEALLTIVQRLRDPKSGCPWDRQQTYASLAPFTIEEAYEVVDAIGRGDTDRLRDELGDLLFQIVFHARLAEEQGRFDFAAVARGIADKLVRRHPHVFADPKAVALDELHVSWEAQKARERASGGARGALADVPLALPALMRAAKLGRRAGRVGFDWDSAALVRAKVAEELAEVDDALVCGRPAAVAEEIGDLLFTIANWARHLEFDAEDALRGAALRFEQRFEHMERAAGRRGRSLEGLSSAQWEELWLAAKAARSEPDAPPACIPVAISARHVHLTAGTVTALFGAGHALRVHAPLAQPGQFAAEETVTLIGPRGRLEAVRVVGPERAADQVEISRTDAFVLGIEAPVRESGALQGTPGLRVEGPCGAVELGHGVICAQRHIHMSPADADVLELRDGDRVEVAVSGHGRALVFGEVLVRVAPDFHMELHLDTDEGNAAGLYPGDQGLLLTPTAALARVVRVLPPPPGPRRAAARSPRRAGPS